MSDISVFQKKIAKFCAWRERSTYEAREKLKEYGALPGQVPLIMDWLVNEKYVNDQRFAESFARGKFNQNLWGKIRIRFELKNKQINSDIIEAALSQIDEADYMAAIRALVRKKYREVKEEDYYIKKQKTMAFLARKGFESDCIYSIFNQMEKEDINLNSHNYDL